MAPPRIPSIDDEPEAMAMAKAIGAAEPPTARARQMIMTRASVKAHTPWAVRKMWATGTIRAQVPV